MKRSRFVFGLLSATLWFVSPVCGAPDTRTVGATYWVGQRNFQYVGKDAAGCDLWLYPHLDGVSEILTAKTGGWWGPLGTCFDPAASRFRHRFSVAALVEHLLAKSASKAEKRLAAKRLALFVRLHATAVGPYYLDPARRAMRKHLTEGGAAWVEAEHKAYTAWLARLKPPGTRVLAAPKALRTSADHYRALVGDGYLDIAIVGGNSEQDLEGNGEKSYHSRSQAEIVLGSLRRQGFTGSWTGSTLHCSKTIRLHGATVRVRLRLTTASHDEAPVRRNLVNLVEGLARADLVIYYGHSNGGSAYYLSERRNRFSRFKGEELGARGRGKLYGLGKKAHQIVALSSCTSYPRYCAPLRRRIDADTTARAPGFAGTNDRAPMVDFPPRCAKLIELITQGAGPTRLTREVNAIRPTKRSPDILFRGVLQPRRSFVAPKGVTVSAITEAGAKGGFLVTGTGSDGVAYPSTSVFPQDKPGEIVQVVSRTKCVLGVSRDGRLLEVSNETLGAPFTVFAPKDPKDPKDRIVFAVQAKLAGKRGVYVLDASGAIQRLSKKGDKLLAVRHDPPPAGVVLVAIGNTSDGWFVGVDAAGKTYRSRSRRWEPLDETASIVATPSLLRGARVHFPD